MKISKDKRLNKLFYRFSTWSGGDGIYSFKYKNKTIIYFSDTFIGKGNRITKKRDKNYSFIHNSLAYFKDDDYSSLKFIYKRNNKVETIFKYQEDDKNFIWLEDGIIENDYLYIFGLLIKDSNDKDIPFIVGNNLLIKLDLTTLETTLDYEIKELNGSSLDKFNLSLGSSLIKEDDYYYIYCYTKDSKKDLHLVRTKSLDDINLEYLDNEGNFSNSPTSLRILKSNFSSEFKVIKRDDYYFIVYTLNSIGNSIYLLKFKDLKEEYKDEILLLKTQEHKGNIITYNSKIQEGLSSFNNLIISYNVNSLDDSSFKRMDIYYPRFLKVNLKEVINEK